MTDKTIRSGPQIVKEFLEELKDDKSLDKGTVEVIDQLYLEKKPTETRLQQGLALKRKEAEQND